MTRNEVFAFMQDAGVPVRLCEISRGLDTDRRRIAKLLSDMTTLKIVKRVGTGMYRLVEADEEPEIVQQGKNCPTERKHPRRRGLYQKPRRWFRETKDPRTIEQRINDIASRGTTLAPAAD